MMRNPETNQTIILTEEFGKLVVIWALSQENLSSGFPTQTNLLSYRDQQEC